MPWTKTYASRTEFEKAISETPGLRGLTYKEAIREATAQLLASDKSVFVIGEGVDDSGGVFGTTKGLQEEFGKDRVMDSPLAENGITGVCVGAAAAGMKPILVHMRVDFLPISLDQIVNHAAKWHYMFGGTLNIPLVIRSIIGRGWGSAAQHSQSLQAMFMNIPGLRVIMPATAYDAKGLLIAASRDGNPVIMIEHRWLYDHMGHVPEEMYEVPLGKAAVRKTGKDLTIVAVSHMVHEALQAAEALSLEGIDCEVLDLRTLKPMDSGAVIESVRKTGRLIVADTGWKECGVGAEVVAKVAEAGVALAAPFIRVSLPECPTPASPALEKAFYPGKEDIMKAARKTAGHGERKTEHNHNSPLL
ncbi:pyruvate dehydrogenase E1 component beta subunit [uncultured bacterium]|nr:pyruvate dehydrogenase E1 component beta subunit [uncultured bacterium]